MMVRYSIRKNDKMNTRFGHALLQAFLHSLVTLLATFLVWAIWVGWIVFVIGRRDAEGSGPWVIYRFGLQIALTVTLVLCSGFFIMSLIYHLRVGIISKQQHILSSLTLTLSSLLLWLALPQGGFPLIALLIGLPILATLWMLGSTKRAQET
jgi:hypothetical protein